MLSDILAFLHCPTPQLWLDMAVTQLDIVLIDHAHCEKKAASSALNLMYRYADKPDLLHKMSRLAREELRHFEQVLKLIQKRKIEYKNISPSGYAKHMHQHIATADPKRLVDQLIIGAIIEARSCERFAALAPLLDEELKTFYESLLKCEARHYKDYLSLASKYSPDPIDDRVDFFLSKEAEYIQSVDDTFRFHSGILT